MATLILTLGVGAWEMAYGADQILRANTPSGLWSVSASALRIERFVGDVEVVTADTDTVVIAVEGSSSGADAISVAVSDEGVLTVTGMAIEQNIGISVSSAEASIVVVNGVRISAGNTVISAGSAAVMNSQRLNIKVPQGMAVAIVDHHYDARVGDIDAPIELDTTGEISVGAVTSADLTVAGNGEITVARVAGSAVVAASGNAQVVIDAGQASRLGIDARGNTGVIVRAHAEEAAVVAAGNASVELASVTGEPVVQTSGNADVEVGE